MTNRAGGTVTALCGAALTLAIGLGLGGAQPSGGGAVPVEPVGGGACIIGLNCGCIPHHTCPTPHPHPGPAGADQHTTPAPQNP